MSFLNPWAIGIGLFALSTPVLVHFLTKPRPRPKPLSTIHFVFEAIQQRRSRHRLRDLLVLLLRTMAIVLIALAIARPLWRQSVIQPANSDVSTARVVILDVSQSMEAGRSGSQPFQRAKIVADRYLQSRTGLVAGVVLAAARAEAVFDQLSGNFAVLRQSVRNSEIRSQSVDALAAINIAAELLSKTDESMKRELVVVSDFQRSDWGTIVFDALPKDTSIQLESVSGGEGNNLGVLEIRVPDRVSTGESFTVEADIGNFSQSERTLDCRLRLGSVTSTVQQTFPPGQSTIAFSLEISGTGWQTGTVRLVAAADDLPADDVRPMVLKVADKPKVTLLTSQNPEAKPSASYYLQSALSHVVGAKSETGLVRLSPESITASKLSGFDVLVIDHPGRLSTSGAKTIADALRRGCGVLYVVSELADGVNVRAIDQQLGANVQLPVRFVPSAGGRARRDLSVFEVSRREPPFDVFGDVLDVAFAQIRVGGGLGTELTDQGLKDRILASLSDRSALLVSSDAGEGKIVILNADLEQSNLPVKPPFLPLLGELVEMLLPKQSGETEATCGLPIVRLMPASVRLEDSLNVSPADDWPESGSGYGTWEASPTGVMWQWPIPDSAGAYKVSRGGEDVMAVAVTTPGSESDLAPLDLTTIESIGAGARPLGYRDANDSTQDEDPWWKWLLVACVMGLVGEVFLLRAFRT